jgi:thioredoxin-dependent peroxiredoxin
MAATPSLNVGDRAPTFTLADQDGNTVSLSDFKGKKRVILIFYPGDMTPGCTMQLCAVRDDWSKFRVLDTVVFGVNPADAESHTAFRKKYAFPFPLLIDKTKSVSTKYGAIRKFGALKLIKRTVVGIDTEGKIVYLRSGMPKNAEILKAIAS